MFTQPNVPGDLITDLFTSGLIPDPFYGQNWLQHADLWWENDWIYSTTFSAPKNLNNTVLVVDGVKMGAFVLLNGAKIATLPNQFLRYSIPVTLREGQNELSFMFPPLVQNSTGIDIEGRVMACSGGWDWNMYSNKFNTVGQRLLSRGIWKDVYLVAWNNVVVDSVVPVVYFRGDYGQNWSPLFDVNVTVHYRSFSQSTFSASFEWTSETLSQQAPSSNGDAAQVTFVLHVNATEDMLWKPVTLNKLWSVEVRNDFIGIVRKSNVGFRSVQFVTASDSDTEPVGTGNFTQRVVVNNVPLFMRGANFIPSSAFEGRVTGDTLDSAVTSAYKANMNVLRVWGGGVYQYEDFYDACDRFGILVFQDMMLTSGGMQSPVPPPSSLHSQTLIDEVQYQVRRLSTHPSVAVYQSCNECGVMPVWQQVFPPIVHEDISRVVWPACPSNGWKTGVNRKSGLPLAFDVELVPNEQTNWYDGHREFHMPYLHGTGFASVNDPDGKLKLFPPLMPPPIQPSKTGMQYNGSYVSEFGCVGMQSDHSLNVTLDESQRHLHSTDMIQRNYPCDNLIIVYFGALSSRWSYNLYACNVAQMLQMSGQISLFRTQNIWGIQIWQLNEIWPTGGWGTMETAALSYLDGQFNGGRWKPLHYALRDHLYNDVFVMCGADGACFVKNDLSFTSDATGALLALDVETGATTAISGFSVPVEAFSTEWFCAVDSANGCQSWDQVLGDVSKVSRFFLSHDCVRGLFSFFFFLKKKNILLLDDGIKPYYMPLTTIGNLKLPYANITVDTSSFTESFPFVYLESDAVAIYVFITSKYCVPTENNLLMLPRQKYTLTMECSDKFLLDDFSVHHAAQVLETATRVVTL